MWNSNMADNDETDDDRPIELVPLNEFETGKFFYEV